MKPLLAEWRVAGLAEASSVPVELPGISLEIALFDTAFWGLHRWRILGLAALIAAQGALIVLLLVNRARWRRAERALLASREQYALAVEGSNDGLWDWNLETDEVFLSARCRELLGYAAGETVKRFASWDERIQPADREQTLAALHSHLEGRSATYRAEYRVAGHNGVPRSMLARGKAQRDAAGQPRRLVGSLSDVTDRALAERAMREMSRRLIVVQEEERARLARELHDDVSQRLARLAIDAGRFEHDEAGSAAGETMREMRESLVRLSEDLHALSYRLHPAVLEDLGLADALQVECDRFARQACIPAALRLNGVPQSVPRGVSICLFRIAQEALRNVGRHARARRVELTLLALDGGLQLAVRDDGVGFDPALARGRPSLGHASMRERVRLAGGEIDIETAVGQGTTIVAWVPLEDKPA